MSTAIALPALRHRLGGRLTFLVLSLVHAALVVACLWSFVAGGELSPGRIIWEFNIRDSNILGIVGSGVLGLLITEATSRFQWGRLSTVLIVVVLLAASFDALSRRIRKALS